MHKEDFVNFTLTFCSPFRKELVEAFLNEPPAPLGLVTIDQGQ